MMQTRSSVDLFDLMSRIGSKAPEVGPIAKEEKSGTPIAPYVLDGFERKEVSPASKLQLSRYDRKVCASNSRTTSFRRVRAMKKAKNNAK
jgi:hypothetical protein